MIGAPFQAGPWSTQRAIGLFERIGRDHVLRVEELGQLDDEATAIATPMWGLYERHWRRFCGTRLDPLGAWLEHPARLTGAIRADRGGPIVVAGTGPSLAAQLPALRRHRSALHLVTSSRGAAVLAAAGLVPDLVLIEHQTALDAQFSVNELQHRPATALAAAPLVAAEARTPAALLRGIAPGRLFVPEPMPTWGLWPATAVALAILGNASAVALVGVDLGTQAAPDPAHAPLRDLLSLLASCTATPCLDLGRGGAPKPGWPSSDLSLLDGGRRVGPLTLESRPWRSGDERVSHLAAALDRLTPLVRQAHETLDAAEAVRDGGASTHLRARLGDGIERLLAASASKTVRVDVQDVLGAGFLPRFWRTPIDPSLGEAAWRLAALACHELVSQHHALRHRLERAA